MATQLLVATLIAGVCAALGLTEWMLARASRAPTRVPAARVPVGTGARPRIAVDAAPTPERVTRLTALTGYRRAVRDDGGRLTLYR